MTATSNVSSSDRSSPAPDESPVRARGGPALIVTTLSLCGIVVSLQQTLMLPLLPALPALLDTTADSASWLVTATLLTGAIATPTVARLADMYGKRRMMVLALAGSAAGSLLGALSQALPWLIGARTLQGVGMALIPVGIAIMRDELPRTHFIHGYVDPLAHRLDGPDAQLRAELVVAALTGLAATLHLFETPSPVGNHDGVLAVYGNLLQQLIDNDTSRTA